MPTLCVFNFRGRPWRGRRSARDSSPPAKSPPAILVYHHTLISAGPDTLKDFLNLLCTTTENGEGGDATPRLHFLHTLYRRAGDE